MKVRKHTRREQIMKYKTTEEIRKAFIADGWNETIDFDEIVLDLNFKQEKAYRMKSTGNIFSTSGKILVYNVKPRRCEGAEV